jgi:O-antigen/teichoic acid export membrane protein
MSLHKQATSVAIMHAADVLQPLIILPYAGRVLGAHNFGLFAYAVAIGQIASTLVEYGFHWTAQREAASARREPAVLSSLFADVVATKAVLFLVVTAIGFVVAEGFLAISKTLFLYTMLPAVGGILFPAWLFVALERAWQAAIAVVLARCLALFGFLVVVTSPDQYQLAVAIQGLIPIVTGLISLPFVIPIGFSGFRSVTLSRVGAQLRAGWRGFLFALVERALITLPVPLVGHFAGYVAAGQYSVAEKFVSAARPFFRVVLDTFLPRVAYYAKHDPVAGLALIRRTFLTLVLGVALGLCLYFIAPYFIIIFFGEEFSGAIPIVQLMSVIPVLMNANLCTSNLYMLNYGHERAWTFLNVLGLIVFLSVSFLLPSHLSDPAIGVVLGEIARECIVLVVSAGFFFRFGTTVIQTSLRPGAGAHAYGVAAGSLLAPPASTVPLRSQR